MICAACGGVASDDARCESCGGSPLLAGSYRLEAVLGQGAFGTTYRAERVEDGLLVCLKELLYQRLASFEAERQFQREAAVLRQLDLPGVPRYIDDFTVESGRAVSLFLAQELVDGETLWQEMDHRRYREDEVLAILRELLGILDGLHTLVPPVVHRDIKPANVMRRRVDGRLVVVDFGAVKDAVRETVSGGPSVAGTIGYMAPEQLQGRASPASDLYGAGVLAVTLLSRKEPADMLDDRHALDWAPHVVVSPGTADLLSRLLDPHPSGRPSSAREAIERIDRLMQAPAPAPVALRPIVRAPPLPAPVTEVAEVEPRRGSGMAVWGVLAALGLAVGLPVMLSLSEDRDPAMKVGADSGPVPHGLLGLRFGMTLAAAKAALPEVTQGEAEPPDTVSLSDAGLITPFGFGKLPGERWRFRTNIGGRLSTCFLDFAVKGGLSNIECDLDGFDSYGPQSVAENAILEQLGSKYGLSRDGGCRTGNDNQFDTTSKISCTWQDPGATLTFHSTFRDFGMGMGVNLSPDSKVRIELTSAEHNDVVRKVESKIRAEQQRKDEQARKDREAREAAERKRLEQAGGGRTL